MLQYPATSLSFFQGIIYFTFDLTRTLDVVMKSQRRDSGKVTRDHDAGMLPALLGTLGR